MVNHDDGEVSSSVDGEGECQAGYGSEDEKVEGYIDSGKEAETDGVHEESKEDEEGDEVGQEFDKINIEYFDEAEEMMMKKE